MTIKERERGSHYLVLTIKERERRSHYLMLTMKERERVTLPDADNEGKREGDVT